MLNLILVLVLPLTVCEAAVTLFYMTKPPNFDKKTVNSDSEKKVYCDNSNNVAVHCFILKKPIKYNEYVGKAAAIIFKEAECSDSIGTEAREVAYLLMDKCEDSTGIRVRKEGEETAAIIAQLKIGNRNVKNRWQLCKTSPKGCITKSQPPIKDPTDWTLYVRPPPKKENNIPDKDSDIPVGLDNGDDIPLEGDDEIPVGGFDTLNIEDDEPSEEDEGHDIGISTWSDDDEDDGKVKVSLFVPKNQEKIYCEKGAYQCLSCSSVRLCAPDPRDPRRFIELERHTCTDLYPYCNYTIGMCDTLPDPECYNPPNVDMATNFYCMRDGWYPDPKSCSRFYICKDNVPYIHRCPKSPVPYYHPKLRLCVKNRAICTDEHSSNQCLLPRNYARKVPIKETTNYFMYCGMNKNVLAVDRCPGAYYYHPIEQMCLFKCPFLGNFMSTDDCTKYYRCSPRPEGGFKTTFVECPPGQGFLEEEYMCAPRHRVPNCQKPFVDSFTK